ncbi:hypothetical protein EV146_104350 [Mesobacillus foraminis]|uniref:Uncharacterized protein n=1 Tax=Mesobacillus foraminis TaxID=279826 RepID=A0A4V2RDV3_9BACI|nr:hypothetical protein EV146_104350 [Mesobacillus foraminis]
MSPPMATSLLRTETSSPSNSSIGPYRKIAVIITAYSSFATMNTILVRKEKINDRVNSFNIITH